MYNWITLYTPETNTTLSINYILMKKKGGGVFWVKDQRKPHEGVGFEKVFFDDVSKFRVERH